MNLKEFLERIIREFKSIIDLSIALGEVAISPTNQLKTEVCVTYCNVPLHECEMLKNIELPAMPATLFLNSINVLLSSTINVLRLL